MCCQKISNLAVINVTRQNQLWWGGVNDHELGHSNHNPYIKMDIATNPKPNETLYYLQKRTKRNEQKKLTRGHNPSPWRAEPSGKSWGGIFLTKLIYVSVKAATSKAFKWNVIPDWAAASARYVTVSTCRSLLYKRSVKCEEAKITILHNHTRSSRLHRAIGDFNPPSPSRRYTWPKWLRQSFKVRYLAGAHLVDYSHLADDSCQWHRFNSSPPVGSGYATENEHEDTSQLWPSEEN